MLRLPGAEVDLFGQLPLGAQPIEDFAVARPLIEKGRLERPDLPVGGIVQGQPLGLVEDRNRRRQPIDHARIVVLVALHIRFQRHDFGNVASDASGADLSARLDGVEGSALAADDRRRAALPGAGLLERRCRFAAHCGIEHFAAAVDRGLSVGSVNGVGVGRVAPDDPAHGVARPCRHVRSFERAAQAVQGALGFSE